MAAVLTIIAVVAGAALAFVNQKTKGPIAQIEEKTLAEGIAKVLGQQELSVESTDTLDNGTIIYTTACGKAVKASDANAFGGTLEVLVGFNADGTISGYQVLKSAETPGLGAKADTWFQKGEKGDIIGMNPAEKNMTVSKDGGDVDAITASTITSRAFLRCVNAAYEAFATNAETPSTEANDATCCEGCPKDASLEAEESVLSEETTCPSEQADASTGATAQKQ